MGIPKFARFLINRYPLILKSIQEEGDVPSIGKKTNNKINSHLSILNLLKSFLKPRQIKFNKNIFFKKQISKKTKFLFY